jgi:hypothetical protein
MMGFEELNPSCELAVELTRGGRGDGQVDGAVARAEGLAKRTCRMGGAQRYPSSQAVLTSRHDQLSPQLHRRRQLLLHRQLGGATSAIADGAHRCLTGRLSRDPSRSSLHDRGNGRPARSPPHHLRVTVTVLDCTWSYLVTVTVHLTIDTHLAAPRPAAGSHRYSPEPRIPQFQKNSDSLKITVDFPRTRHYVPVMFRPPEGRIAIGTKRGSECDGRDGVGREGRCSAGIPEGAP